MPINEKDRSILRGLAERQAEIASLSVHKQTILEWKRLNANLPGRPLVWINEIPWHEMDVNGELTLQTTDPFCQALEGGFRRTFYQWEHVRGDMVVEDRYYCPLVIHDTGFGISEDVRIARTDERSGIISREFHSQIDSEDDLVKIKTPVVTYDEEATERNYQCLKDLFGDILKVERKGISHCWFAPWDQLIRWWDVQKALVDLVLRPELVHQAMQRLTDAHLSRLEQWRQQNLLAQTNGNYRVGSGGPGITDELPQEDFDASHVRTIDQWGCATAQIFSDVSPPMHEEFALQYERRWMEHFGLNYYGCCEPLHDKIEVMESIPNLRKISMSPWADVEQMVEKVNGRYVLSHKPNPAIVAVEQWNVDQARENLTEVLERTRGCAVEIILKDISTVRYDPKRLWYWAEMATEVVNS